METLFTTLFVICAGGMLIGMIIGMFDTVRPRDHGLLGWLNRYSQLGPVIAVGFFIVVVVTAMVAMIVVG